MRYQILCLLLITSHCTIRSVTADDALFSEIAMESVFAKSPAASTQVAIPSGSDNIERITGPQTLTEALKLAGLQPKRSKQAVSITVNRSGWKLPTTMTVDVQNDRISCQMSLVTLDRTSKVDSEQLLALMSVARQTGNASFVFDSSKRMLQLRKTFGNRDLTTASLKSEIASLADTAIAHSEKWKKLSPKTNLKSSTQTTAVSTGNTTVRPTGSVSITGKWAASLPSDGSIAIELRGDGTFSMVHVAGNQAAVSTGTLLRKSTRLTLSEAGKADVAFEIVSITATKMELRIVDSSGKSGRLLNFSKANS